VGGGGWAGGLAGWLAGWLAARAGLVKLYQQINSNDAHFTPYYYLITPSITRPDYV
jgi:hypothetical protein